MKDINRQDPEKMREAIDLILREIERSDNEKLRYKKDLMKAFVEERFFSIDPDMDITKAYEEYEKEQLQARIEQFSHENGVDEEIITELLSRYIMDDKSLAKEDIRKRRSEEECDRNNPDNRSATASSSAAKDNSDDAPALVW